MRESGRAGRRRVQDDMLLRRARLLRVDELWHHGLVVIVAPAGSGKSTVLRQLADHHDGRDDVHVVALSLADGAGGGSPSRFADRLAEAFDAQPAPGAFAPSADPTEPADAERLLRRLSAAADARRLLLLLDDVHHLRDAEDLAVLRSLVDELPSAVALVVASREPVAALPRRLTRRRIDLDGEDLRFRSWEVEALFRDVFHTPLTPADAALLSRRTQGWVTGLALFHLATANRPAGERHRAIDTLPRSRAVRSFLTANVLAELPGEIGDFLLGTCLLGALTGPLCDEVLGRRGSHEVLEQLERRQIFTSSADGGVVYRYHAVLRSHLEATLIERYGADEVRQGNLRAGEVLARHGFHADALAAYARAGEWAEAARVLARHGSALADDERPGDWLDHFPPAFAEQDPWLSLAEARRRSLDGDLRGSVQAYRRAEQLFDDPYALRMCTEERWAVSVWCGEDRSVPARHWSARIRAALRRDPGALARERPATGGDALADAVCLLLAGQPGRARAALVELASYDGTPTVGTAARLCLAVVDALAGEPVGDRLADVSLQADLDGRGLLARAARAMGALSPGGEPAAAGDVAHVCREVGDEWGELIALLAAALGGAIRGRPDPAAAAELVRMARALDACTVEAWGQAALALTLSQLADPEAELATTRAEQAAATAKVPGARVLTEFARSRQSIEQAGQHEALATALAEDYAIQVEIGPAESDPVDDVQPDPAQPGAAGPGHLSSPRPGVGTPLEVRVFGGFTLLLDGQVPNWSALKPRPRAALRILAAHAGEPVHREVLVEALWPGVDADTGRRNVNVAMSALRRFLEPDVERGQGRLVVRIGETYLLGLPGESRCDARDFTECVSRGREAISAGRTDEAGLAMWRAVELYRGHVLPEEGPADWIVELRERYRVRAGECARQLAEIRLSAGRPDEAADAARRAIGMDRCDDRAWRLLIEAHRRAGDAAATATTTREYDEMLADLGLDAGLSQPRVIDLTGRRADLVSLRPGSVRG